MEFARKCISDGANVNYNEEVSYDVHIYHIERSLGHMHYYLFLTLSTAIQATE